MHRHATEKYCIYVDETNHYTQLTLRSMENIVQHHSKLLKIFNSKLSAEYMYELCVKKYGIRFGSPPVIKQMLVDSYKDARKKKYKLMPYDRIFSDIVQSVNSAPK